MKVDLLLAIFFALLVEMLIRVDKIAGVRQLEQLATGKFFKPVKQRVRKEKSAVIKLWRPKGKWTVNDDDTSALMYNSRQVCADFIVEIYVK